MALWMFEFIVLSYSLVLEMLQGGLPVAHDDGLCHGSFHCLFTCGIVQQ